MTIASWVQEQGTTLRDCARTGALILILALVGCTPDAPPPDLAIVDVTVIDAAGGRQGNRTVVVDSGRIVQVLAAGERVEAAQVVDGRGRYLIPGLWDFHVHLTYDERFTEAMPGMFLSWGITSIRDTGGVLEKLLPVVAPLKAEGVVAPRVFFAGPLLDGEYVVYDGVNRPALGIANPDVATARANIAALADAGVDFVKIYEMISPEVFDALVEAAGERGLPIDGHVPLSMVARDVAPRVQSLEHLRNIELDCSADADQLLAARRRVLAAHDGGPGADLRSRLHGEQRLAAVATYDRARCLEVLESMQMTIQVPTLRLNALALAPPFERADWNTALARVPADAATEWRSAGDRQRAGPPSRDTTYAAFSLALVGEMYAQGVPIGAGTDTPISYAIPGYSLHNELEMLVRAGLPPLEALRAATLRPAEFFGREGEMGTVEVGRLADLVLLSADPLADIANTRAIEAVVTRGVLLGRAELDSLVATRR